MSTPIVFVEGKPVRLGKRIGKGGEGEVYAIEGRADQALKFYTLSDPGDRAAKIEAMVRAGLAAQSKLVSYPSALAKDGRGRFAGFLMRLVSGHQPIHHLYAPGDRKANFPSADYRFLIRTALNVARALADVHSRNCVIGDINHSGVLVSDQAIVALIDADSFQITDGGREFLCTVGVPEYTPPELQGRSLSGVRRTQNHDAFGLAVIVFQLLCMGRHPFVGSFSQGEMPMEKAIAEHRFAYSSKRSVGMTPPPGTVTLADLPPPIATAFEAAFDPAARRPTAAQWVGLLEDLEKRLTHCASNKLHYYPSAATECPWCRMERTVGIVLFLSGTTQSGARTPGAASVFDLQSVWAAIEKVQLPPLKAPDPILPDFSLDPSGDAIGVAAKSRKQRRSNAALLCVAIFGIAVAPHLIIVWLALGGYNIFRLVGPTTAGAAIRKQLEQRNSQWVSALADWERRCGSAEVHAAKRTLVDAKKQLQALPGDHKAKLANYDANRRDFQLRSHMESHRVGVAKIRGVGPALRVALASWGIDSAQEVSYQRIIGIDGFGPAKAQAMMVWRQQVASAFVFDPRPNAADAREKDRINREFGLKGDQLRSSLARGANDLKVASRNVLVRWQAVDGPLARIYRDRIQAEVDNALVNAPLFQRLTTMGLLGWAMAAVLIVGLLAVVGTMSQREDTPRPVAAPTAPERPALEEFAPPKSYVVSKTVGIRVANVRSSAAADAPIIDRLSAGSVVSIVGRIKAADGTTWLAYRRPDEALAFIAEKLLQENDGSEAARPCSSGPWPSPLLCRDKALRELDAEVRARYRTTLASMISRDRERLDSTQQEWLRRRNSCRMRTDSANCLTSSYRERLSQLANAAEGRPETGSAADLDDGKAEGRREIPAAEPAQVTPPRLRGDPEALISADDYPSSALREERSGRVSVRLHVTAVGSVDGCDVIASSGSSDLDETACRLLRRRSRYSPAQDVSGRPVEGSVTRTIRWSLPE